MEKAMRENVLNALDSMRPFLQSDSGDIELVEITDDAIVKVKFTGACSLCPMSQMTLRAGVERALMRQVPGIRRVESVSM